MQDTHPVIKAMVAVMIHLIGSAAMLHEGLCDDVRGGEAQCAHTRKLVSTKMCFKPIGFNKPLEKLVIISLVVVPSVNSLSVQCYFNTMEFKTNIIQPCFCSKNSIINDFYSEPVFALKGICLVSSEGMQF